MPQFIKHKPGTQRLIQIGGDGYVFVVRANISLAEVKDEHVEKILQVKGGCCGSKQPVFMKANEDDIRRWKNGGGS